MPSKPSYVTTIKQCCEDAGTYKPSLDPVIKQLADILKRREKLLKEWKAEGENFVVKNINVSGNTYYTKEPRVEILNKLEDNALKHWISLGVTPKEADKQETTKKSGCVTLGDFMKKAEEKAGIR